MDEILRNLRDGTRVLDVGSLNGSFSLDRCPAAIMVARLDLECPPAGRRADGSREDFVQADAAKLPFTDRCFNAIVANHSLEHIDNYPSALAEIGRVVCPGGSLFVAVPDASTFSDKLYRWVYGGGGHINGFRSAQALALEITRATGLKLAGSRTLYSSFEYLHSYYFRPKTPRRLWLVGNGNRSAIRVLSYATRLIDRMFKTRLSIYGWALYFGEVGETVETAAWSNVCIGCGRAHPAAWLEAAKLLHRRFGIFRAYSCPACNCINYFTPDQ